MAAVALHTYAPTAALYSPLALAELRASATTASIRAAIAAQVGFYFSDANWRTDKFLKKEARKSTEGWIRTDIIAGFKKMQKLGASWRHIRAALPLGIQECCELSPTGEQIRRELDRPVPVARKAAWARTVAVENLNHGLSVSEVLDIFVKAGSVVIATLNDPARQKVWIDTKTYLHTMSKTQNLAIKRGRRCWVVEMADVTGYIAALGLDQSARNWRGIKVTPLIGARKMEGGGSSPEYENIGPKAEKRTGQNGSPAVDVAVAEGDKNTPDVPLTIARRPLRLASSVPKMPSGVVRIPRAPTATDGPWLGRGRGRGSALWN